MTFGISPPKNVKNLFGDWLVGINKRDAKQIRVGVCAIIKFLTEQEFPHFCKLYRQLPIRSICDPIYSQWSFGRPWLLGVTVWRRSHGTYLAIRLAA
jgi:hypothetical protein